jgi:hypothetical protein
VVREPIPPSLVLLTCHSKTTSMPSNSMLDRCSRESTATCLLFMCPNAAAAAAVLRMRRFYDFLPLSNTHQPPCRTAIDCRYVFPTLPLCYSPTHSVVPLHSATALMNHSTRSFQPIPMFPTTFATLFNHLSTTKTSSRSCPTTPRTLSLVSRASRVVPLVSSLTNLRSLLVASISMPA